MENYTVIPKIAVHPDRIVYYKSYVGNRSRLHRSTEFNPPPTEHKHEGNVSQKASRKITKAITYLVECSKVKSFASDKYKKVFPFRIAFITLTLPSKQIHTDKEIMKSIFHQFLVQAKVKWKVSRYVWRSERQKNGNIHFHILVDRFVPWSELRDTWNNCTEKLGYISAYRNEMRRFHNGGFKCRQELLQNWSYKKQLIAYHSGVANDWSSPNSTDVHAVKQIQNIKAYVCKYMLKSSQSDADIARLWGCSYELSRAKGAVMALDSYVSTAIERIRFLFHPKEFSKEHFSVMFIDCVHLARAGLESLFEPFQAYMLETFNHNVNVAVSVACK